MTGLLPHAVRHPGSSAFTLDGDSARDATSRLDMKKAGVIQPLRAMKAEEPRIAISTYHPKRERSRRRSRSEQLPDPAIGSLSSNATRGTRSYPAAESGSTHGRCRSSPFSLDRNLQAAFGDRTKAVSVRRELTVTVYKKEYKPCTIRFETHLTVTNSPSSSGSKFRSCRPAHDAPPFPHRRPDRHRGAVSRLAAVEGKRQGAQYEERRTKNGQAGP